MTTLALAINNLSAAALRRTTASVSGTQFHPPRGKLADLSQNLPITQAFAKKSPINTKTPLMRPTYSPIAPQGLFNFDF